MIEKLINYLMGVIPDDFLCLLHESIFDEMRNRKFIIYTDEIDVEINK